MDNVLINNILIKNKPYKFVCFWRNSKNDKSVDDKGNLFPYPKKENTWSGQVAFLNQLKLVEKYLELIGKYEIDENCTNSENNKQTKCLICKKTNDCKKKYILGKYVWNDELYHYVKHHNIKPPIEFVDKIWNSEISIQPNQTITVNGDIKVSNNQKYLRLGRNQLMIIDALMKHGGYNKKYYDLQNDQLIRYSEHAGYLDVRGKYIENIIVSGNTLRVDRGDEEIFLPANSPDAYNYKYIFHTHPPTPKPGGRANEGFLYEFPSIGDILHFIDHHNDGNTLGSLVMAPEGLYNIRNKENVKNNIQIDEDDMYDQIRKIQRKVQEIAIKKYGINFSTYDFYSKISQDREFIDLINEKLIKYGLIIDYYPRTKDFRGSWIIDSVYIPIY